MRYFGDVGNKFKAMEILSEMIHGEEYNIIVSGRTKRWEADHRWDLKDPDWLNSDRDTDNWWNKEKAFEGWWEKTRENHKR